MTLARVAGRAVDGLAIATFTGMFACVLAQVVFRYFFGDPLVWSDELGALPVHLVLVPRLGDRGAQAQPPVRVDHGGSTCAERSRAAWHCWARSPRSRSRRCSSTTACRIAARNWDVETTSLAMSMGVVYAIVPAAAVAVAFHALADARAALQALFGSREASRLIELMLGILAAWFVSLFVGPTIYAAMGFAGFAFLVLSGIPGIVIPQKIAMAANSFPLLAAPLVHPHGQPDELGRHQLPHFRFREGGRRLDARRLVPGEHRGLGDLRRHERVRGRRCRGTRHGRDRGDEEGGLRRRNRGRDHGRLRNDRPDHSAFVADDRLRRHRRNLDRRVVPRWRRSRGC